jgi:glycerol-3-phosphate O-acyltransferase
VTAWIIVGVSIVVLFFGGAWYARRSGRRALLRFRGRLDRFKLASRQSVRERLLDDPVVADAVRAHAAATATSEAAAWKRVEEYVHEIVPFFNVVAYY